MLRIYRFSLLFIYLLVTAGRLKAQYSSVAFHSKEWQQFRQTRTLVVLQESAVFDTALVHAVRENWNLTPYKFISLHEVDNFIGDPLYSFLLPYNIEFTRTNDISVITETRYYFCLINGGKNRLRKYKYEDLLAFSPFDFNGIEQDRMKSAYRMDLIIKSLQHTINLIEIKKIKGNNLKLINKLNTEYNRKSDLLKSKTLLIHPEMLQEKLTEEDIRSVYPFKFLISNRDWINQAINERNKEYCYLVKTAGYDYNIQIYNLESGQICYAWYSLTGSIKLNRFDFKRLSKAIMKM